MTRWAALLLACVGFFGFDSAGMAANKAVPNLPAGFAIPADFREDTARRQYFDFDTSQIDSQHKVDGHVWHIAVAALQPNNDANVIVAAFAADLEQAGWTIVRKQGTLIAHKTSDPESWIKAQGNSGDFRIELVEVATPARSLTLKPPTTEVETVSDTQDLPYLAPLPGSKMDKTIHDQRAIEIKLPNASASTLAISDMTRWYDEPPGVSSYEFATVYQTALTAAGWDVTRVQVGGDAAITAHFGKNGRDIWLYTHSDGTKQSLNVVDYGAETKKTALEKQLAKDGHVALYGIYFDTDSAVPRPESEATLENVLAMLTADPSLQLEIQGHTDDTGAADHNATLSDARAASVVQWLTDKGIAADRLTSKGYGATMPVADNKSPEGRAKNRRVELALRAGAEAETAAAIGPAVTLPKGTVLTCALAPASGDSETLLITNSTGKVLKKETVINTVLASQDDCFALGSDLAAGRAITRKSALVAGAPDKTCQAYISALHPMVVHSADGGAMTYCDPP